MSFCEDCNMHDGVTQEYYMSKELMVSLTINSKNNHNHIIFLYYVFNRILLRVVKKY